MLIPNGELYKTGRSYANDDRQKRGHEKNAVGERQIFFADDLRQNSVFGRSKERTVRPHEKQHGQHHFKLILKQRHRSQKYDANFCNLAQHDDRSLACPV